MKKRFLSTLMALVLALSLVPTAALAAENGTALPAASDGVITLDESVTLDGTWAPTESVTLDLNGHTLTLPRMDANNGITLTITDNSGGEGKVVSTTTFGAVAWPGGTVILENGTITSNQLSNSSNTAVFNLGTFIMRGGKVEGGTSGGTGVYNTAWNGDTFIDNQIVCDIEGGEIEASYGVCAMGPGISNGDLSTVDNNHVVVNISGGTIRTNGQGIATNASSGSRAGFTINMSDGEIVDMDGASTGMYLPAIGETNITGGSITAAQAIRIGAGELNITGGTITCTAEANGEDLVPGASGGTTGAIVVGKASGGYVGDIVVNVSGRAVIQNTAERIGDEDTVYPTIVVSDKNMADSSNQQFQDPKTGNKIEATFQYSETSTSVFVDTDVYGDIVKISAIDRESGGTQDGGNTTLTIQDATVTGNVTNQSQTGLIIRDTTIDGNVSNTSNGSTAVLGNSTIIGSATDDANGGTLYVENGESTETYYAINERTSKVYTDLNDAISEASEGDTITLLDDIKVSLDGIDNTSGAITINKSITLNGDRNTITATSAGSEKGIAHIIVVSGSEVTIEKLNLNGNNQIARYGVQAYGSGVELTLDTVSSFDNYAYGAFANSGAAVIADNLTTSGNGWGGVNVDNGGNLTINSGDLSGDTYSVVIEGTGNEATLKGGNYKLIQVKTESGGTNTLTISGGNYQNIVGSDDGNPVKAETVVTGGNFETSVAGVATTPDYEVKKNSGTYPFSYMDDYADAVEAAGPGGVVTAVKAEGTTTYTVTFDYGDSRADTVSTVAAGTEITLPSPGTRSGYDFTGWYSGNTRYDEGDEVTVTGNMTFTASWSERNTGSSGSDSEPSYSPVMDVSKGGSVKVNPRTPGEGDEVTITVDPDRGYEVGDVTVTDRSGRDVRVTAERDGTYTFEQPKGRVTIAVTFVREGTSTFFADVAETYWAYDEIAWAYENGYVNGVTATTFAPGASISRQQIWMILARIAGDDPADMAAARQWSIDNGISDGTNPGSAVTRQQLAALLYRYAQMMGYANEARVDLSSFPDAGSVASYAVEPMQWSVANSIVGGTTDGTLNPTGTATRAQFAVMLYRFWTGV